MSQGRKKSMENVSSDGGRRNSVPSRPKVRTGGPTVKRLRLSKVLTIQDNTSVYDACRQMAARRAVAILLTDSNSLLCGILTDKDIAIRVVACELNLVDTPVSEVMTRNPVFVLSDTLAVEALKKMVQGKFKFLPVVENGKVIATLDIANCLYDAIAHMEMASVKGNAIRSAVKGLEKHWGTSIPAYFLNPKYHFVRRLWEQNDLKLAVHEVYARLFPDGSTASNFGNELLTFKDSRGLFASMAAVQSRDKMMPYPNTFIETLRERMFGHSLSTIIMENSKVVNVSPTDSVLTTAKKMLELRLSSAVVMVGSKPRAMLTSNDILMRVIAQNLPPDSTPVEKVMTLNPECASVYTSIADALHIMHDGEFLHFPVVDEEGGIVAVMNVTHITHAAAALATVGNTEGVGNEATIAMMQKFWVSAMALGPLTDDEDTLTDDEDTQRVLLAGGRAVKQLRLSKALTIPDNTSVYDACQRMADRRVDVVLLTDSNALLCGILTDKDIAIRVVARELNIEDTPVSKVMTRDPVFVLLDTLVVEALQTMVQGKFRHLPVMENGELFAMLDMAKCLYDAIARMERAAEKGKAIGAAVEGPNTFTETPQERIFRPSLSTIIMENSKVVIVSPTDSVLTAAKKMLELRLSSAVVTVGSKPRGILTSKDILLRVIAQNLPPNSTPVEKVMTPNPECATVDTPIVDALHIMHDGKFLHLPVANKGGIVAVIDVIHISRAAAALATVGNAGGVGNEATSAMMQKFWDSAMALVHLIDDEDTQRLYAHKFSVLVNHILEVDDSGLKGAKTISLNGTLLWWSYIPQSQPDQKFLTLHQWPANIWIANKYTRSSEEGWIFELAHWDTTEGSMKLASEGTDTGRTAVFPPSSLGTTTTFGFKLEDRKGQMHRFNCETGSLTDLITAILQRVDDDIDQNHLPQILYEDEDHDKVILVSDSDLAAAVDHARLAGWKGLRLHLDYSRSGGRRKRGDGSGSMDYEHKDAWAAAYSAVAAGAALVAGLGVMAYLKRSSS